MSRRRCCYQGEHYTKSCNGRPFSINGFNLEYHYRSSTPFNKYLTGNKANPTAAAVKTTTTTKTPRNPTDQKDWTDSNAILHVFVFKKLIQCVFFEPSLHLKLIKKTVGQSGKALSLKMKMAIPLLIPGPN